MATLEETSAEAAALASAYRLRAKWALDYANGDGVAGRVYALLPREGGHAVALVELVHAPRIQRLKVLNVYFEPRLDVLQPYEEEFREVITALAAAVMQSVGLIFEELPAKEVKIYGRNDHMHAVLDAFKDIFSGDDNPLPVIEAARQGAWLVFTKTTEE